MCMGDCINEIKIKNVLFLFKTLQCNASFIITLQCNKFHGLVQDCNNSASLFMVLTGVHFQIQTVSCKPGVSRAL